MFISILLLCGLVCALVLMLVFDVYNWYILIAFLVGLLIGVILIALAIFIGSFFIKNEEYEKSSKFHLRAVCRATEFLLYGSRSKLMIRGLNKIPTDKKCLIITNHQSMFDSIASVWALRAFPISVVYKNSLTKAFMLGKYLRASGFISIDRSNPREGVKAINRAAEKIISGNASVLICPEGTRSNGYEMGEFHNGSFKISLKAKCPIVLCAIQNTCNVRKRFPFRSTNIYFDVVEVIEYEKFKDMSTQEIADYAYKVIKANLDELPKY